MNLEDPTSKGSNRPRCFRSVYAVGSLEDGTLGVLTESITGLGSNPSRVDTGNSPIDNGGSGVNILWLILLGVAGVGIAGTFSRGRAAPRRDHGPGLAPSGAPDPGASVEPASPSPFESAPPVRLTIVDIGVDEAPVESVGVLPDGRFEVPDARVLRRQRGGCR